MKAGSSVVTSGSTTVASGANSSLLYVNSSGVLTTSNAPVFLPSSSTQTLRLGGTSSTATVFDLLASSTTGTLGIDIAGGNGGGVIDFWTEPTQVTLNGQIIGNTATSINGTAANKGDFILIAGNTLPAQPNNLRLWAGNVDVVDVSSGSVAMNKILLTAGGFQPQTNAAPRTNVTPAFAGQLCWDSTALIMCNSTGTVATSWTIVGSSTTACPH